MQLLQVKIENSPNADKRRDWLKKKDKPKYNKKESKHTWRNTNEANHECYDQECAGEDGRGTEQVNISFLPK